jgi:hypothetical protein
MKVQKSHLRIALFILGAAVLYSLFGYLRPGLRTAGPSVPPQPLLVAGPSAGPGGVDPLTIPAPPDIELARVPSWSRDPFLFGNESRRFQPTVVRNNGPDPTVRSILFSSTRRLAIVDGRIVGVGDSIGVFKVADIEQGAVVFSLSSGERRRVPVHGPSHLGLTR